MVAEWASLTGGEPISRKAVARHRAAHLSLFPARSPGPRPVATGLLEKIVANVEEGVDTGELRPTVRDGIASQVALNNRAERQTDRDAMLKFAQILGGANVFPVVIEGQSREAAARALGSSAWADTEEAEAERLEDDAELRLLSEGERAVPSDNPFERPRRARGHA